MKTSELTGAALNWAVAKCEGFESFEFWHTEAVTTRYDNGVMRTHMFSTDWAQGGPIIERVGIRTEPEAFSSTGFASWRADTPNGATSEHGYKWCFGPTPLIAAMRCFVASKLGDEVALPDVLLSAN